MVSAPALELPRAIAEELVAHARAGLPDEACGILSGTGATVTRFHPAVNGDASPYRYSIESQDLLRIVTEIEDADDEILAIYHSHTQSPAFPSRTDVELAFWPDAAYLIVSLAHGPRRPQGLRHRRRQDRPPRAPPRRLSLDQACAGAASAASSWAGPSSELRTKTRHATTPRTAITKMPQKASV